MNFFRRFSKKEKITGGIRRFFHFRLRETLEREKVIPNFPQTQAHGLLKPNNK